MKTEPPFLPNAPKYAFVGAFVVATLFLVTIATPGAIAGPDAGGCLIVGFFFGGVFITFLSAGIVAYQGNEKFRRDWKNQTGGDS